MLPFLLHLLFVGCNSVPVGKASSKDTCGYASCTDADPDLLNVHIVPHTHDDVGWLKTVDQYYYGSRNRIQQAGVQYILDSVVKELWEDPQRKFMYVETAFFWKWWNRQKDNVRQKVHTLVQQGRLQFVGGAWSMNDEAASHYQSTIDQFTRGLGLLNKTFGYCGMPKVGWQIDPFGHSREFASLLAAMGYDGLFLGRIDYQDKGNRLDKKTMEVLWRADDDLGAASDIFTGVLYNTYSPPPGFCFDILCQDEPIIDDPDSPMYNLDSRVATFMTYVQKQAQHYRTNNVILTMGGDFTYQDAGMWYHNLDKLIEYTNLKAAQKGEKLKLFYSTPNCYLKAIKDAKPKLPTKTDDFFPYASDENSYWTGYFTSRPTTKYFERQGNNYLQMVKQLQVLTNLEEHNQFVIDELRNVMGVFQHHDAITGTEKQHVTNDYVRMLDAAIEDALLVARQAFNKIDQGDALKVPLLTYDRCPLNESSCYTTETSKKFVVTVYNPLGWSLPVTPIRLPVVKGVYDVVDYKGAAVQSELFPLHPKVLQLPARVSRATHELLFIAMDVPAMGTASYYVLRTDTKEELNEDEEHQRHILKRSAEAMPSIEDLLNEVRVTTNEVNLEDIPKEMFDKTIENSKHNRQKKIIKDTISDDYKNMQINIEKDINFYILKDKNVHNDKNVEELMRTVKESTESDKTAGSRKSIKENSYPYLNDDEMRMLGDDPYVVTVPDNDLESETTATDAEEPAGSSSVSVHGHTLGMSVGYYPGCVGSNEKPSLRSSGAYIFRPNATKSINLKHHSSNVVTGSLAIDTSYTIETDNLVVSGIFRIYKNDVLARNHIENEWLVSPLPINDNIGKEIVFKYNTGIINNGEFYTDSNGRQMLKRTLNKRNDYNVTLAEPVAGNYYPITNRISIKDDKVKFTILTDRSEGGASLEEGVIELMLHRRLLHDDAFGVGEALNETLNNQGLAVRGTHRLLINSNDADESKTALEVHLKPQIFVSNAEKMSLDQFVALKSRFSPLKSDMPEGIHLLTLEPFDGKLLIRLENYLVTSDAKSTVSVDFRNIFKNIEVKSYRETTLAANQWLDEYKKWNWESDFENVNTSSDVKIDNDSWNIVLKPKQIRTFIVDYVYNNSS